jgi:prophage maintenance system killer protein
MLAYSLNIDREELSKVINEYTRALEILDSYDHQTLEKPKGSQNDYVMTYQEAREIIDSMKFNEMSSVFGVEKEKGKLNGIIAQIYQDVFGQELYPSIEEKAAHLLYFLVKDHPFADGCKRIAATLFINFLYKNNHLYRNNKQILSNEALVAITILTAESNPNEMEIIVKLITNLLQ